MVQFKTHLAESSKKDHGSKRTVFTMMTITIIIIIIINYIHSFTSVLYFTF
jgi:hypothetical protein